MKLIKKINVMYDPDKSMSFDEFINTDPTGESEKNTKKPTACVH